ncbi:MAG: MotA/TolQ/ExbB proton channel family protein [Gammaproteobacteria bacterium]
MFDYLGALFSQGGAVMPWILLLSILMWALILERYWFLCLEYPRLIGRVQHAWSMRTEYRSRTARRLRAQKIAALSLEARRYLPFVRILIQVLPFLGLLGTVLGLIHTFEVISVFGGNNRSGIAAGISEALVATLSGLFCAISGLYFSANLESRAVLAQEQAETLQRE